MKKQLLLLALATGFIATGKISAAAEAEHSPKEQLWLMLDDAIKKGDLETVRALVPEQIGLFERCPIPLLDIKNFPDDPREFFNPGKHTNNNSSPFLIALQVLNFVVNQEAMNAIVKQQLAIVNYLYNLFSRPPYLYILKEPHH